MGTFDGRTVLVTGSTRGIGKAIARTFAEKGADVIVQGRSGTAESDVVKEIEALGRRCLAYDVDIADVKAATAMVTDILKQWGKIDILINNAGIYPAVNCVDVDEAHFDTVVDVNLKGTFFLTQAVVKQSMIPNNYGRIVSISSCDGKCPAAGVAIYSAAKAGVISLVKSFALELADYDINSNCVAPGWVETETVLAGERWKDAIKIIPSRRLGRLSEVGEACCFLCDDKVAYINGEVLDVNGAIIMD